MAHLAPKASTHPEPTSAAARTPASVRPTADLAILSIILMQSS